MDVERPLVDEHAVSGSISDSGVKASGRRPGCVTMLLGVALVLVGIPMLVCPGPGMAVIAAGFGMVAVGLGIRRRGEDS